MDTMDKQGCSYSEPILDLKVEDTEMDEFTNPVNTLIPARIPGENNTFFKAQKNSSEADMNIPHMLDQSFSKWESKALVEDEDSKLINSETKALFPFNSNERCTNEMFAGGLSQEHFPATDLSKSMSLSDDMSLTTFWNSNASQGRFLDANAAHNVVWDDYVSHTSFINSSAPQRMLLDEKALHYLHNTSDVAREGVVKADNTYLCRKRQPENSIFTCESCSKTFTTNRRLKIHQRIHTGAKPYSCGQCQKSYQDVCGLKSHMTRVHSDTKAYICKLCDKAFAECKDLKSHMLVHSSEKAYNCGVCSKDFKRESDLRIHMFVHSGDEPMSCEICQKKFATRGRLKTHMVIHSGETPHSCVYCEKSFSLLGNLKVHIARVHGGEKNHACQFCDKTFAGRSNLKVHLLLHSGAKPHVCEVCDKRFTRSSHLKDHLKLHSGETPYSCQICMKQYKFLCSYKVHMRTHTGERPYSCDYCSKTFKHSSNLKRHNCKPNSNPFELVKNYTDVIDNVNYNCKSELSVDADECNDDAVDNIDDKADLYKRNNTDQKSYA